MASFKRRSKTQSKRRRIRGGEGGASDFGVKLWGYNQVADPNQGNLIKANVISGGGVAAPYMNAPPTMGEMPSTGDMSKQALDIQNASIKNMTTTQVASNVQTQSVLPKMGGRRKTRRVKS